MSVLESKKYDDIISWSLDGKAFIIKRQEEFENIVLPDCFKLSKFSSFLRKLYRWRFSKSRMHSSPKYPAYANDIFKRGGEVNGRIMAAILSSTPSTASSSMKLQNQAELLIGTNQKFHYPSPSPYQIKIDVSRGDRAGPEQNFRKRIISISDHPTKAHVDICGLRSDDLNPHSLLSQSLKSLTHSVLRSRRRHQKIISACYNNLRTMQHARQQLAGQRQENAKLSFQLMQMRKRQARK